MKIGITKKGERKEENRHASNNNVVEPWKGRRKE